jgi:hypothetical protein
VDHHPPSPTNSSSATELSNRACLDHKRNEPDDAHLGGNKSPAPKPKQRRAAASAAATMGQKRKAPPAKAPTVSDSASTSIDSDSDSTSTWTDLTRQEKEEDNKDEEEEEEEEEEEGFLADVATSMGWGAARYSHIPGLDKHLVGRVLVIVEHGGTALLSLQLGRIRKYYNIPIGSGKFNYEMKLVHRRGYQDVALNAERYSTGLNRVGQWVLFEEV